MSKRKTDNFDDIHFSSDRFFFANNKWYYYVRTYDNDVNTVGGFPTKEAAMTNASDRFDNLIDHYSFHTQSKDK